MGAVDEVKQKIDIVEVIGQDVTLTKAGRTFKGLCPFHSEKNPSFYVYPEQQSWHCFGCNNGGDVFSFIMKKQNIDFGEALRQLAQKAGVVIPTRFEPGMESEEKQRLYNVNQAAAQYFHNLLLNSPAGKKARDYAAGRGFTEQTIKDFQLGYSLESWEALKKYLLEREYTEKDMLDAGLIIEGESGKKPHDRFRNKLMFPILDIRGRVTGFGGRALDGSLPKYTNSPQTPLFDKSGTIYGINLAKDAIREQDTAVIVEGYMDVITAHQNGFKNAVASMGTAVTERQVHILKRLTRNLTLALDADAAGEEATLRTVGYENTLDAEIKVIIMPEGKDPDDVIKEDAKNWEKLVAAVPIIDYTFDRATAGLDLNTARGKASARDSLLPIIGEIKDNVRRAHYLQKLANRLNVSERDLEADLARIRPKQPRRQVKAPQPPPPAPVRSNLSSPREEYCLALLLQHPELKHKDVGLLPDYFENSENKEIFIAWRKSGKIDTIRKKLEPAIHEHLDSLATKKLLSNNLEQKYAQCALDLREKSLRSLKHKQEAVLALEAQSGGTTAELAKLKELGIEVDRQLAEVVKSRRRFEQRG